MSSYDELLDILKHLLFNRFSPQASYTRGLLGDGLGNVQVPDRPDKSYVRFNRGSSEYFEVFNRTVNPVNDWPVLIGELPWQPGLTQVVDTDWSAFEQSGWGDSLGDTSPHAPTHEWPDGSPGSDPVDIFVRSIVPLRGYALTGTVFYANSLEYEYQGSGHVWGGLPGINLAPVISDTVTGTMRYAGVYLDPLTNGLLVVTGSTTVHSSAIEPPLVSFPQGVVPVSRVRIYGSQTYLSEADIREARRLFDPVNYSTGTVSGGIWPAFGELNYDDGTAYATVALLNAAIAEFHAGYIGTSTFACENETLLQNRHFIGAGQAAAILQSTASTTCLTLNLGASISNLKISISNAGTITGINVAGASDVKVIRAWIDVTSTNADTKAVHVNGQVLLEDCLITANAVTTDYAIYVASNKYCEVLGGNIVGDIYVDSGGTIVFENLPIVSGDVTSHATGIIQGAWQDVYGNVQNASTAPLPTKVNINGLVYQTWTAANATLGSGEQAIIGEGSFSSSAESVADGADIKGCGIDVSVLTGTGLQTLLLNDGTNVLQDFTIENTAAGGRVALSIGVSGGADGTCINIKGKSTATSGTATGIRVYRSNAILISCLGEASGGSSNYALYVDDSASGTTTQSFDSIYTGDVYATGANATLKIYGGLITGNVTQASSATLELYGPKITGTLSGTWGGSYFDANDDLHLDSDEAAVKQRSIDIFTTSITDHYDGSAFTGYTWAAYAGFVTPANIDVSFFPSMAAIWHSDAQATARSFGYRSSYSANISCRCVPTADVRSGLRMDDGTDNNYAELFLEYNSGGSGLMQLRYRYSVAGVPTGPTNLWATEAPVQFVVLTMLRSGDYAFFYYAIDAPTPVFLTGPAITSWSPTRSGIYHESLLGTGNSIYRSSIFDWYKQ